MMHRVVSVIKYSEAKTISFFLFIGLFLPLCLSAFCFSGFTFFVLKFNDFIFCLITLLSAAFSLCNMTACCFSFTLFSCSFSRFLKGEEVRFSADSVFHFNCLNTEYRNFVMRGNLFQNFWGRFKAKILINNW